MKYVCLPHILLCFLLFTALSSFAQPSADFIVDTDQGCSPLVAQFTDQSTGNITTWDWQLGDADAGCNTGPNTTMTSPARIFTSPGLYCICLTVTDDTGASDTECKTDFIEVFGAPTADFTAPVVEGCVPLTVDFSDISVSGAGNIVNWQWDLNNGNCPSNNSPNISCTYSSPGTYDISLIVTDDNGCSHFIQKDDFITVDELPDPDFTADVQSTCSSTLTATFTPNIVNSAVFTFEWDFGDGGSSTSYDPTYTFNNPGSYPVTLIVTNTFSGCRDSLTQNSFVNVGSPVVFDYTSDQGCEGLGVSFTDLTNGNSSNWQWDFGDGNSSNDQNPTHIYTQPGCYTVSLSADTDGCSGSLTATSCIEIFPPPTASFTSANLMGCALPHTATFTASSPDSIVSWSWDFGDGATGTGQTSSHDYNQYGSFPVSLTFTSLAGCVDSITIDTVVLEQFQVSASTDSIGGCAPQTFNLEATWNGAAPITSVDWDFGNGDFGTGANTTVTYPDTGHYTITVAALNDWGCTDTSTIMVEVGMPLIVEFSADPLVACAEDPISFFDESLNADIDEWLWDFGDGTFSTEQFPMHMYRDTGFYTICLSIFNNGCESILCKEDYIQILPPIARFGSVHNCIDPYSWDFVDNSIGADTWSWDFGVAGIDTDTSTLVNPSYTFPVRGTYLITLVVTNAVTGCSFTRSNQIRVLDPEAIFSVAPDTGCALLRVPIANSSIDAVSYAYSAQGANIIPSPSDPAPELRYPFAGIYTGIQLIVTDDYGCQDTLVLPDSILVSDVYPGFFSSDPAGCSPIEVSFSDTSSTFGAPITGWFWDFGDGQTSTDQNPTNNFNTIGQQDVSLTVTNALGCNEIITLAEYIDVTYPNIDFDSPTFICTGQSLTFENNSDVGEPAAYLWDFGDGNTSSLLNPSHTYAAEGTYSICLTGTDRNGCDSTLCKPNYVTVGNPVSNFVADTTYASCPPLLVNFTDLSANADAWEWDFGDFSASVNTQNAPHIYTEPGSYDVCLYITSASGCRDTLCFIDYIVIEGPTASFTFAPDEGCAPLEVTLLAVGEDVVKYTWDSGCGDVQVHNSAMPNDTAVFVYDESGVCFPILVVEDSQGCQRTYVSPDPITIDELNADFTPIDTVLCNEGTVLFESSTISSLNQFDYLWEFPGGTPSSATTATQAVFYDTPGTYDVNLIVSSGLCSDTVRRQNVVTVGDTPSVDFTYTPNGGCEPQVIDFTSIISMNMGSLDTLVWDFGTGDSSTVRNPQFIYTQAGTYTITLYVRSTFGCENSISKTIEILLVPTADAGLDQEMCQGESVMLTVTGGVSYSWTPTNGLSCSDCAQPEASPNATTEYIVTAMAINGCTNTDTVMVNVIPFPVPSLNITGPNTVCEGEFVQLNASSNLQDVEFYWDQSREGLSCYDNCFNPFATPAFTTTYLVTVVGPGGCSRMDSITVEVIYSNAEIAGQDRTICAGDQVTLNLQNAFNPTWSPFSGLSCATCPNPVASPTETTTYHITATTGDGCSITDSIKVTVMAIDAVNAGEDLTICIGETADLAGDGKGIVTWSPGNSLSSTSTLNTQATPNSTTTYNLNIVNDLCELDDQVTVFVRERADVTAGDAEICIGETAILNASGFADTFVWTSEDGLNYQGEQIQVSPEATTSYTVVGTRGNCVPDFAVATVTVNSLPIIELPTTIGSFQGGETQIELEVEGNGNGNFEYLWTPATGLSCATCEDPIAAPDSSLVYQVAVTDVNGCTATAALRVSVKDECSQELIVVPNAFTPNNDGLNDILYVRGSAISSISSFRIYDRWGNMVFETTDKSIGWDGTIEGKPANPGVFVYYVEAPCFKDGSPILKKGNITLIR